MKLPILYSRSTSGKISTWEIEYNEDSYRTTSGFQGMKLITSEWTKCKGKSYNTTAEQTEKQAKALHKKKVESGMFEDVSKVDEETFFEPMLAEKWEKYKNKISYPVFSQPKLDGMRCIVKKDGMWSRTGKKVVSAPHIFKALEPLFKTNPNLIFDGELYCDKLANDFNKIISCVSKTKPTTEDLIECEKHIEYHIYDLPSSGKFPFSLRNVETFTIKLPTCCKLVPTCLLNNEQEVKNRFIEYISAGYEGQMLRLDLPYENKRSKSLMKDKVMETEEFEILGVTEGEGKLTGKVGTFQIKTKNGVEVDVTVNGSHDKLEQLWKRKDELIGKECTVRYFGVTNDGSLRFPKCIDIDRWQYE